MVTVWVLNFRRAIVLKLSGSCLEAGDAEKHQSQWRKDANSDANSGAISRAAVSSERRRSPQYDAGLHRKAPVSAAWRRFSQHGAGIRRMTPADRDENNEHHHDHDAGFPAASDVIQR